MGGINIAMLVSIMISNAGDAQGLVGYELIP
jgi:hypothetical protein